MASSNPYAPPQHDDFSALATGSASDLRLAGDTLIFDKGASLPRLCLFSGEPSDERTSRTLWWAPQWAFVIVAVSPLIGAIVYFVVRKSGTVEYSLSAAARKRQRSGRWLLIGGALGGVVFATAAGAGKLPALSLLSIAVALILIIVGSVRSRLFHIARIDKQQIHLRLRSEAARAFERYLAGAR